MKWIDSLSGKSKTTAFLLGLGLDAGLTMAEFFSGRAISFAIFNLVPVSLVAWFAGKRLGILMAFFSTATWFFFDINMLTEVPTFAHFWNAAVRFGFLGIVAFLLSALKRALERERESARTDHLTGAANTRQFFELAEREIDKMKRYGRPLTAVYVDLDNFKSVNDRFGHQTGDDLLAVVADTLRDHVRKVDVVARLGGDEFAILLPETGQKSAEAVVQKTREQLLRGMQDRGWPVTFSIGVATFLDCPESVDEMIEKADALMYIVKNNGKNTVKHMVLGGAVAVDGKERPTRW
jgi:diguanylate cyclase (GGDEF)-like protein